MSPAPDDEFVFNIVWNGTVFTYLRYFVASQIAESDARFRFVVNVCPPDQVALDGAVRREVPGSDRRTVRRLAREDGRPRRRARRGPRRCETTATYFCFIDPDILAKGPFLPSSPSCSTDRARR